MWTHRLAMGRSWRVVGPFAWRTSARRRSSRSSILIWRLINDNLRPTFDQRLSDAVSGQLPASAVGDVRVLVRWAIHRVNSGYTQG
jgi:hypothetical protein